ncbi:MAG: FG-GAP repeat protein [Verrucomicrobiota bacterium]|jgi:hypothetical protein
MNGMRGIAIAFAAFALGAGLAGAGEKVPTFRKIQLTDKFWSEGASYGDFNRDGKMDIVSGPFWYGAGRVTLVFCCFCDLLASGKGGDLY